MRDGGIAAICLAMVADSPATRVQGDGRILAIRQPEEGELYRWSKRAFDRLLALVREQQLAVIDSTAALRVARPDRPSVIVSAEGGDFLDRSIERLDEAFAQLSAALELAPDRPDYRQALEWLEGLRR